MNKKSILIGTLLFLVLLGLLSGFRFYQNKIIEEERDAIATRIENEKIALEVIEKEKSKLLAINERVDVAINKLEKDNGLQGRSSTIYRIDVNGDKAIDAIVVFGMGYADGNGHHDFVQIYVSDGDKFKEYEPIMIGSRGGFWPTNKAPTVSNGEIILEGLMTGENDSMCCPSVAATERLSVKNGKLSITDPDSTDFGSAAINYVLDNLSRITKVEKGCTTFSRNNLADKVGFVLFDEFCNKNVDKWSASFIAYKNGNIDMGNEAFYRPPQPARPWYSVSINGNSCIEIMSPAERIELLQSFGQKVETRDEGPHDSLTKVEVSYTKGLNIASYTFWRSFQQCEASLPKNQPISQRYN